MNGPLDELKQRRSKNLFSMYVPRWWWALSPYQSFFKSISCWRRGSSFCLCLLVSDQNYKCHCSELCRHNKPSWLLQAYCWQLVRMRSWQPCDVTLCLTIAPAPKWSQYWFICASVATSAACLCGCCLVEPNTDKVEFQAWTRFCGQLASD